MIYRHTSVLRDVQDIDERKPDEDAEIKQAYEQAMRAKEMKQNERIEKYYSCALSDEEMDEDENEWKSTVEEKSKAVENRNGGANEDDDDDDDDDDDVSLNSTERVTFLFFAIS